MSLRAPRAWSRLRRDFVTEFTLNEVKVFLAMTFARVLDEIFPYSIGCYW
jgi:hypothetical protein